MSTEDFQELIWEYAKENTRSMPWRLNTETYYVLVSEVMLQQTQVDRVIPKFEQFIATFPDIKTLASAQLSDVLKIWSGLGYARRAKFLHQTAQLIQQKHNGQIPLSVDSLISLPGIGPNTAAAIVVYSANEPVPFVETNIRTVYLHHFFHDRNDVSDAEILEKVEATLDRELPREWYWALMDYGAYLKKQGLTHLHRSKHYKKQSAFEGSIRQVRGQILRALGGGQMKDTELKKTIAADERFSIAIDALMQEGFVKQEKGIYSLA